MSFRRTALQPSVSQFVHITRITPSQLENPVLALVRFHVADDCQLSNLCISLCKDSLPSMESTAPPSLVSSANLLKVHSTPVPRSFMKTLKSTGPKTDPWGIPLVTGCKPDITPFTIILWAQPISKLLTEVLWTCLAVCWTFCPEWYCERQYQKHC